MDYSISKIQPYLKCNDKVDLFKILKHSKQACIEKEFDRSLDQYLSDFEKLLKEIDALKNQSNACFKLLWKEAVLLAHIKRW